MLAEINEGSVRSPRPYQRAGIDWLHTKERAFLTDGFGLGKTCQAIWAAEWPCLVAAPVHLLDHWRREIIACFPDARVCVASGAGTMDRQRQMNAAFARGADFYVCNIELLRTDMHIWFDPLRPAAIAAGAGIKTLVVDEAHRLRGRNSQQSHGAFMVSTRVSRLYLLTATPVYNTPADLYAMLHMIDPARFSSYYKFIETYLAVHQTAWGPKILGLKKSKALLGVFREYALGRTREEVRAQLPPLQQSLLTVEPDPDWYKNYERLKYDLRGKYDGSVTSRQNVLQRLRAFTQQPKLQAVCMLIQDNGCEAHTLIYTYHRDLAYAVGSLLKVPVVTGDMAPAKREAVARGNDFVVATFPSVAEGLNFSHMRNVIFMEHSWEPGMMNQALNRVHRPGNTHDATMVYHVVVKGSVDSVIYRANRQRGMTMNEIVEAALVPVDEGVDEGVDEDVADDA